MTPEIKQKLMAMGVTLGVHIVWFLFSGVMAGAIWNCTMPRLFSLKRISVIDAYLLILLFWFLLPV